MPRRFLLDVMLGSLATCLRMCGHDAAYALDRNVEADAVVLELAREADRQLLTLDVALADAGPYGEVRTSASATGEGVTGRTWPNCWARCSRRPGPNRFLRASHQPRVFTDGR